MVINGSSLVQAVPMVNMLKTKERFLNTSHGLSEAGYDIRIAQTLNFYPPDPWKISQDNFDYDNCSLKTEEYQKDRFMKAFFGYTELTHATGRIETNYGRFSLASTMEEFVMPTNLNAIVHDKSTWARLGVSVFNTVIEPNWFGFLTLEIVFHGNEPVEIKAGQGIAQVIFHELKEEGNYGDGKYQNAGNFPQKSLG